MVLLNFRNSEYNNKTCDIQITIHMHTLIAPMNQYTRLDRSLLLHCLRALDICCKIPVTSPLSPLSEQTAATYVHVYIVSIHIYFNKLFLLIIYKLQFSMYNEICMSTLSYKHLPHFLYSKSHFCTSHVTAHLGAQK